MHKLVGAILDYNGTSYQIRRVTERAIALGCNDTQEVWVTKDWVRSQGFGVKLGKHPASLWI